MHSIEVGLHEGFRDDTVVLRVNGAEAAKLSGVTTKALLGLAAHHVVKASKLPASIEISLPRRGLSQAIETSAPFLDVDVSAGAITIRESRERRVYM